MVIRSPQMNKVPMRQTSCDRSLGDGVYFAPDDYIGLGPRIVVFVVDSIVLAALLWIVAFLWFNTIGDYPGTFLLLAISLIWVYLVPLKRSDTRTLGFRTVGCKLVTLKGSRPSNSMLTFRTLLWMFGPCNFLLDLIWCGIDDDRQTMRDRFSNMCLIRNNAEPIGTGEIHLAYFNAFGYNLMYPRVVHPKASAST